MTDPLIDRLRDVAARIHPVAEDPLPGVQAWARRRRRKVRGLQTVAVLLVLAGSVTGGLTLRTSSRAVVTTISASPTPTPSSPRSSVSPAPFSTVLPTACPTQTGSEFDGVGAAGIRWHIDVPDTHTAGTFTAGPSQPVVVDGIAYASAGGRVMAVRDSDGTQLWNVPGSGAGGWVVGDNYVLEEDQALQAYDLRTGAVVWRHTESGNILGYPVRTGPTGLAIHAQSGYTTVVDLDTGAVRWTALNKGEPIVLADDRVVLSIDSAIGIDPSFTTADDATTGKRLWRQSLAGGENIVFSDGDVVGFDQNAGLEALDEITGQKRWSRTGIRAFPVAAVPDGVLTSNGLAGVSVFNTTDGSTRWTAPGDKLDSRLPSPLLDVDDNDAVAYLTSGFPSTAIGRDLTTGKLRWQNSQPGGSPDGPTTATSGPELLAAVFDNGKGLVTKISVNDGVIAWYADLPDVPVGNAVADGDNAVVMTHSALCGTAISGGVATVPPG